VRAIGLDIHRAFCEVAIHEGGLSRSAGRVKTTPEALWSSPGFVDTSALSALGALREDGVHAVFVGFPP
jgi:hypothetical protein